MMANDTRTTFTNRMAGFALFSIALDESTDLSDTVQLAIFIRGVDKELTVIEELLALQPLKGTTTGEDILMKFKRVESLDLASTTVDWQHLCGNAIAHFAGPPASVQRHYRIPFGREWIVPERTTARCGGLTAIDCASTSNTSKAAESSRRSHNGIELAI
ncbi:General transcription factor II-I repeat domain-containing protein 2A [Eumeta japonica]|uniref:General transcription factor II-I repeat domain-containing protein 2A n=1 Tax=Eumeta variegata TaxID=151549 RepID=A0A4C1YF70_EUMVA|nr:General transcription factor II-I repeat domain-containing protein 2A [Eumeta japonica]